MTAPIELYRLIWCHNVLHQHHVAIIGQLWKAGLLCKYQGRKTAVYRVSPFENRRIELIISCFKITSMKYE